MPTENNIINEPRPGREFWDKLNAIPRYAFFLSPSGTSVQKFEDKALGNWIDVHEAQKVVDQAMDRISELQDAYVASGGREHVLREERDALQADLDAKDQRVDELLEIAQTLTVQLHEALGNTKYHEDCIRDLAALNPTPKPHTCCGSCPAGCNSGAKP
ncbi:hypothetical protein [Pseudomonas chlororaphis]|uniref:hypothetical protein n=1 Tax=Pseudomonas chlororaphis TaxID=587753 RepID=UPI003C152492